MCKSYRWRVYKKKVNDFKELYEKLVFGHSKGVNVTGDLKQVLICEKMGWTFQDYDSQPIYFIDMLFTKINLDLKKEAKENKELERKSKRKR